MKNATSFAIFLCFSVVIGCERGIRKMSAEQAYVIALYDDSEALTIAGDQWGRAMEPWFLGKEADVEKLAAADIHFKTTIESVRRRFEDRRIPNNRKAREFAALVSDYLAWQMQMRNTFAEWHAIVRSENPPLLRLDKRSSESCVR
ncbi:MAG: hypothetical protein AAF664_20380 [Planctomycetota bacterium]